MSCASRPPELPCATASPLYVSFFCYQASLSPSLSAYPQGVQGALLHDGPPVGQEGVHLSITQLIKGPQDLLLLPLLAKGRSKKQLVLWYLHGNMHEPPRHILRCMCVQKQCVLPANVHHQQIKSNLHAVGQSTSFTSLIRKSSLLHRYLMAWPRPNSHVAIALSRALCAGSAHPPCTSVNISSSHHEASQSSTATGEGSCPAGSSTQCILALISYAPACCACPMFHCKDAV